MTTGTDFYTESSQEMKNGVSMLTSNNGNNGVQETHQAPRVRQDLHPDEFMLCVWWDWEGIGHWETLEKNQTVNKDLDVAQLRRVNEALQSERRNRERQVILLHDNAHPHTASVVKITHAGAGMGSPSAPAVLTRPCPYRLPSVPLAIKSYFWEHFENGEHLENWLKNFFDSKTDDFWKSGFNKLAD
ncbi:transposase, partial [Ostertagia ostertagi]